MKSIKQQILFLSIFTSQISLADLRVHEWGTFTSVIGSNGQSLDGMAHEDESLPDFVHGLGETIAQGPSRPPENDASDPICGKGVPCHVLRTNRITQKMETPVIYFYSDIKSGIQKVDVNVQFPLGVISQTFPAPVRTHPNSTATQLVGGDTTFSVEILPRSSQEQFVQFIPQVETHNIYSHARYVESNIVRTRSPSIRSQDEYEKFIFYRGLGQFQPKLSLQSQAGSLTIENSNNLRISSVILLNVTQFGNLAVKDLKLFAPGNKVTLSANEMRNFTSNKVPSDYNLTLESTKQRLVENLINAGLYHDEAVAMINTWENGYLKNPGLRILYILDETEVQSILPMKISPTPGELKRVFVGRLEVLLDTYEKKLAQEILSARILFNVNSLGRFAEPKLRRAYQVAILMNGPLTTDQHKLFQELIESVRPGGPMTSILQ